MSSVGEKALAFDENFIATPHQVTLREKILFLGLLSVFLSFFLSIFLSGICYMTFSRIKNLTSKNLPKISKEFTIVINLTPSDAWFEGVLLRP